MKDSRLSFGAGIIRVLRANGDHGGSEHGRFVYAGKGSSMDDGKRGVKQSPVIVKILFMFRWESVRELAHTES
jgi:hypothetical protein